MSLSVEAFKNHAQYVLAATCNFCPRTFESHSHYLKDLLDNTDGEIQKEIDSKLSIVSDLNLVRMTEKAKKKNPGGRSKVGDIRVCCDDCLNSRKWRDLEVIDEDAE